MEIPDNLTTATFQNPNTDTYNDYLGTSSARPAIGSIPDVLISDSPNGDHHRHQAPVWPARFYHARGDSLHVKIAIYGELLCGALLLYPLQPA